MVPFEQCLEAAEQIGVGRAVAAALAVEPACHEADHRRRQRAQHMRTAENSGRVLGKDLLHGGADLRRAAHHGRLRQCAAQAFRGKQRLVEYFGGDRQHPALGIRHEAEAVDVADRHVDDLHRLERQYVWPPFPEKRRFRHPRGLEATHYGGVCTLDRLFKYLILSFLF
jgi:hypothetical protein